MFEITHPVASVPGVVFLTETADGKPAVDWDWDGGREPSRGDLLHDFAGLADIPESEFGAAVVSFVKSHGPLHMCDKHHRYKSGVSCPGVRDIEIILDQLPEVVREIVTPQSLLCRPLSPEPLSLWKSESRDVANTLKVAAALMAGRVPDVSRILYSKAGVPEGSREHVRVFYQRELMKLERAGEMPADHLRALWAWADRTADDQEEEMKAKADKLRHGIEWLRKKAPRDREGAWAWVRGQVWDGLHRHRPMIGTLKDPTGEGLRPQLVPGGILGKVYLHLAFIVSGRVEATETATLATCYGCGEVFTSSRRPRQDRRSWCQECRESGAPERQRKRNERARKRRR